MTQYYVGTKIVMAWEQSQNGAPGYAVKYEDGYTSWSPQDVFEAAYLPIGNNPSLEPHEVRAKAELVQLRDRISKLRSFADNARYASLQPSERQLLSQQLHAMNEYELYLGARVNKTEMPGSGG